MGKCLANNSGDQIKTKTFVVVVVLLDIRYVHYVKKPSSNTSAFQSRHLFEFYMDKNHIKSSYLRGSNQKQKHFMTH